MSLIVVSAAKSKVLVEGNEIPGVQSVDFKVRRRQADIEAIGVAERIGIEQGQVIVTGSLRISSLNTALDDYLYPVDPPGFNMVLTLNVGVGINEALEYANRHYTTVHTIGIGTEDGGSVGDGGFVVGLDVETLETIAERTNGKFYRAETSEELEKAFTEIATSTKRNVTFEMTSYLMIIALSLFMLELVLVNTKYRTIP